MKNVKRIEFRMKIVGNGIVNFDNNDQKFMFNGTNLQRLFNPNDNVNYSKKNVYLNDKGDLYYKVKISSNSLRHSIFEDSVFSQSPTLMHDDRTLTLFTASPMGLLRGYMFASKKGDTIKHKGSLMITSAEQCSEGISKLDFFSRTGEKDEDPDVKDTTIFMKETIGEVTYQAEGSIDVRELQFLSCDKIFGRYGFNPDKFDLYKALFETKLKSYDGELGYYQMKGSDVELPEYGIKIGNKVVVDLVKWGLDRVANYYIGKNDGYAKIVSLEYRYITDGINQDKNPWMSINSDADIESIDFEADSRYLSVDSEEAMKVREGIDLAILKEKADKKQATLKKEKPTKKK